MAATTDIPTPTEASPSPGIVCLEGVEITTAIHFAEDGVHVIRSTEFDVSASGDTFDEAVTKLIDNIEDFAEYIAATDRNEMTEDEVRAAATIFERYARAYRKAAARLERESVRRRIRQFMRGRRRGDPPRGRFLERPNSSRLLHV